MNFRILIIAIILLLIAIWIHCNKLQDYEDNIESGIGFRSNRPSCNV